MGLRDITNGLGDMHLVDISGVVFQTCFRCCMIFFGFPLAVLEE